MLKINTIQNNVSKNINDFKTHLVLSNYLSEVLVNRGAKISACNLNHAKNWKLTQRTWRQNIKSNLSTVQQMFPRVLHNPQSIWEQIQN